jgi:hypothetical protein
MSKLRGPACAERYLDTVLLRSVIELGRIKFICVFTTHAVDSLNRQIDID